MPNTPHSSRGPSRASRGAFSCTAEEARLAMGPAAAAPFRGACELRTGPHPERIGSRPPSPPGGRMRTAKILSAAAAVAALAATAPGATAQTPPAPSVVLAYQFTIPGATTKFRKLELKSVPAGSTVVVRCLTASGDRCRGKLRKVFTRADAGGTVRVKRFEGKRMKPGMKL